MEDIISSTSNIRMSRKKVKVASPHSLLLLALGLRNFAATTNHPLSSDRPPLHATPRSLGIVCWWSLRWPTKTPWDQMEGRQVGFFHERSLIPPVKEVVRSRQLVAAFKHPAFFFFIPWDLSPKLWASLRWHFKSPVFRVHAMLARDSALFLQRLWTVPVQPMTI